MLLKKDDVLPIFVSQAGLLSSDNLDDPDTRTVIYTEFVNLTFEDTLAQWLAISAIIETSARENNIPFVDAYNQVPHNELYFTDQVHLTERGNAKLAEILLNEMVTNPQVEDLLLGKTTKLPQVNYHQRW